MVNQKALLKKILTFFQKFFISFTLVNEETFPSVFIYPISELARPSWISQIFPVVVQVVLWTFAKPC